MDMSTYEPMLQDWKVVFEEHKPLNQEQAKNTRKYHLWYEWYFSLNRNCKNTYFTLIEEQASIDIQLSLTLLLSNLPRRGLSFEGKLSSLGEVTCLYFYPLPSYL
jgi:hypothetical protein